KGSGWACGVGIRRPGGAVSVGTPGCGIRRPLLSCGYGIAPGGSPPLEGTPPTGGTPILGSPRIGPSDIPAGAPQSAQPATEAGMSCCLWNQGRGGPL